MRIELKIAEMSAEALQSMYGASFSADQIQVQQTRKELIGDLTVVVFPLTRLSKKSPEITAREVGDYLLSKVPEIRTFEVIKGFLNLVLTDHFWLDFFDSVSQQRAYGFIQVTEQSHTVVVEYSSPNTNKPLHLGHIRNNLLGFAVSQIIAATGKRVAMVNLVNDRGIHICKSMLAWKYWGEGSTPESTGIKGDKLVGDYYVRFDKEYKIQIAQAIQEGLSEEEAKKSVPLIREAQSMLQKWEEGDKEVVDLWKRMNTWVYAGFDETYHKLGVRFDKIYYESETYMLGKKLVEEGLSKGVLFRKEDGSVWADLTEDGLDQKLLLRSDGTSVYMTQDLGTAHQRYSEYKFDKQVYVVGNEQNYHFKVLSLILKKLGYSWADHLYHLSYGMVELPEGKMKSREGTVVDADDLIDEMTHTARIVSDELGKLDAYPPEEKESIYFKIAMGALKYFILKVDPQKTMLFNPTESIDFNGNTGPFIQYTYVRIRSIEKRAAEAGIHITSKHKYPEVLNESESSLIKRIYRFPNVLTEAGENMSPALIANYLFDLVKEYNQFYQQSPILREEDHDRQVFRLKLSVFTANHISDSMSLLGIEMPERM